MPKHVTQSHVHFNRRKRTAEEKFSSCFPSLFLRSSSAQLLPACCTISSWPCSPGCASRASTCTSLWSASSTTKVFCTETSTSSATAALRSWWPSRRRSAPSITAPIKCKFNPWLKTLPVCAEVVMTKPVLGWRLKVRLK